MSKPDPGFPCLVDQADQFDRVADGRVVVQPGRYGYVEFRVWDEVVADNHDPAHAVDFALTRDQTLAMVAEVSRLCELYGPTP
jgi:hypothetical protein